MNLTNDSVPNPLRLLNEWRDTVLATVVVLAFGMDFVSFYSASLTLWSRECIRFYAWRFLSNPQVVGGRRPLNSGDVSDATMMLMLVIDGSRQIEMHSFWWASVSVYFFLSVFWPSMNFAVPY